ncbi:MAG: LysR family transcriptional regulator [Myxococcales bacterium]|nr:LysR family transcriptional regulator [Myxococcales bacterium]
MYPITLDQLTVFLTVAEQGSFSAAARSLRRAQSAVSYAIANLERLLEVELFDRAGRTPRLTDAGRSLLADARTVVSQVELLSARAKGIAGGIEPELALVVDMMFPTSILTLALRAFLEEFPTVSLRLYTEGLGAVSQHVLTGTCSLGISGPMLTSSPKLARVPLLQIQMRTVVASTHPLATHDAPIGTADLRDQIQIVLTDRSPLTAGVDAGVLANRTWRVADLHTKHALLVEGFGWGNMPLHLVAEDLQAGRLRSIHPVEFGEEFTMPISLLYRASTPPGVAGGWLRDTLLALCGDFHERASSLVE